MTHRPKSLVDILRWRANNQANRLAYRFLVDGEYEEVVWNYAELDRRARAIAALLQAFTNAGDRTLLLFPPGLDFIAAYFGCLYAKVIAVPAYPPHAARLEKNLPIITGIAANAASTVALTTASLFNALSSADVFKSRLPGMTLLATDNDEILNHAEEWEPPHIQGNDVAFLQYTSGSTSAPKGVMISHDNLLYNLALIEEVFEQSTESRGVSWLPAYHDMGLIGGILQPLYVGFPMTLMSHLNFLQRPYRWLAAISHYKATTSGAPNFAYDLCTEKIKPEKRELLNLSCWDVAFNGAEPVHYKTLKRFAACFAPCGFRRNAFQPCYGLAEATLLVGAAAKAHAPKIIHLVSSALEQNDIIIASPGSSDARTLVSCGRLKDGHGLRTVDPKTLEPCTPGKVGEIWMSGPGIALGYWNNPAENDVSFGAHLSNTGEGPFLRTGDLGFTHEKELFITGRLKDLIIIDGKNHYPNDIEQTIENSHPAIRAGGSAAFAINTGESERLIAVVEIDHRSDAAEAEVIKAIRYAVSLNHDVSISGIRFTAVGTIPRTTSGKIKRYSCKEEYLAGNFKEIKTA